MRAGPSGSAWQEAGLKPLQAAAVKSRGVSVEQKAQRQDLEQVCIRKRNESEPTEDASLRSLASSKTRSVNPLLGQVCQAPDDWADGTGVEGSVSWCRLLRVLQEPVLRWQGRSTKRRKTARREYRGGALGGPIRVVKRPCNGAGAKDRVRWSYGRTTGNRKMQIHTTDKPFKITRSKVRGLQSGSNQCGLGPVWTADDRAVRFRLAEQSLQALEPAELGSYFPPPVRAVSIPKKTGGQRILGVPTVADRVAQMVVQTTH